MMFSFDLYLAATLLALKTGPAQAVCFFCSDRGFLNSSAH
jgi:hypothetical protein